MPRPVPADTSVPENSIALRSPKAASGATGATPLSTGTDSPVRIASSALSPRVSNKRRSAGTRSPASTNTMSPGTNSAASMPIRRPPRSTAERGANIPRIAAMACSARPSCTKPTMAFTMTTAKMTPVSTQCCKSAVTVAEPSST